MNVRVLTEHHYEFLSLKGGIQARLSLHMSKCHIVANLMPRPKLWKVTLLESIPPAHPSVGKECNPCDSQIRTMTYILLGLGGWIKEKKFGTKNSYTPNTCTSPYPLRPYGSLQ